MKLKNTAPIYALSIFFITLIFLSLWIWQGIDLTDTGYNLTKQWMIFNGGIKSQLDLSFGSSLLGGLWNLIIPGNYLIWAYFGYVFIGALTALFVFLLLKDYFDKKISFFAVLISLPIAYVHLIKVPNYNIIPLLFLIISIYLISKGIRSKKLNLQIMFSLLAGLVFSIAVISRFMLVSFLGFPILLIIYSVYFKKFYKQWLKITSFFFSGAIIGFIIILFFMKKYQIFDIYISNLASTLSSLFNKSSGSQSPYGDIYSSESLLNFTLKYYFISILTIPIILIFLGVSSNIIKIKNRILKYIIIFIFAVFIVWFSYNYFVSHGSGYYRNAVFYTLFALSLFVTLLIIYKSKDQSLNFILVLSLFVQITMNLGSKVLNYTCLYITLPVFVIFLYECNKHEFSPGFRSVLGFTRFKAAIILIILFFGFFNSYIYVYRDSQDRFSLVHGFQTKNLVCVLSTDNRTKIIDEAISEIKEYVRPGDEILALNSIPLIYYITETKCPTRNPWALHLETVSFFKEEISQILKTNPPKIIVIAKGQTRLNSEWPITLRIEITQPEVQKDTEEKLKFLYDILKESGFVLNWENKGFEIYKK